MPKVKIARSYRDALVGFILDYQKRHPGAAHLNDVAQWVLDQGLWEPPCRLRPLTILSRDLKRAAKESRIVDPQRRKVRAMLPAKIERVDANGNKVFDVVWDHIFKMSAHHALLFLSQQYENIEKQCRSHKRVRPVFYTRRDFFVVSCYVMDEGRLPGRFHGATECSALLTFHD